MQDTSAPEESEEHPERRPRLGWRFVLSAFAAAVVLAGIVRAVLIDVYYIPSDSMEPLLEAGDRILVSKTDYRQGSIERGDVVVFDGRGSFAPLDSGQPAVVDGLHAAGQWLGIAGSDTVYVKRVIGLPGDRVACCDAGGRIEVNGQPIREDYLYPGDVPSESNFSVEVPQGRLWVLGDHRSVSADSRSLLGAPGGGFVPADRVIGRPLSILWPLDRAGELQLTGPVPEPLLDEQ